MTINLSDINSRVLANHIVPKELVEAVLMVAKIKGYPSVDEYVVDVIADDLISIREGGQGFLEFGEKLAEYLDNIEYLEERYPSVSAPKTKTKNNNNKNNEATKTTTTNDDIIKKYTTTDLLSKEEVESRFGKAPPDDDDDYKEKET